MTLTVGAASAGCALIVTIVDPAEMHVVSVADLAVTMYSPGGTSVKMPFELV